MDRHRRPHCALEQRLQPNDELRDVERLGEVVVAARREPGQPVRDAAPRREEEHRHVDPPRPQRGAHVTAVGVGEVDVHDDHIGSRSGHRPHRAHAVDRDRHDEALVDKAPLEDVTQAVVVLDDENPVRGHGVEYAGRCHQPRVDRSLTQEEFIADIAT